MFGPMVLDPQLPERTSLQQAQGAAKPVHMWPGEAAQEMAGYFDQVLDQVLAQTQIQAAAARPALRPQTEVILEDENTGDTAVSDSDRA